MEGKEAMSEEEGLFDDGDNEVPIAQNNLLTEFQHKFDQALRQSTRNLLVKDFMILFDPDSVYGMRPQFHKALLVTDLYPQFPNGLVFLLG